MTKLSGGLNNYYVVSIKNPQRKEQEPYQAECEDIIQALGMTFDEGCAFKALWRNAAARMGNGKPGNKALYECEKLVHYANRILAKERLADELLNPNTISIVGCWHYPRNSKPYITESVRFIEVAYKGELDNVVRYNVDEIKDIRWNQVHRFRIIR